MYGLVNRAIEGLVRRDFGDDVWNRVVERAGVGQSGFVAMEVYDDAVTYGLVGAASQELKLAPEVLLEAFGEYWTTYTIEEGYGATLDLMGDSLEAFLDNLDELHARVGSSMPGLVPPSFSREVVGQDDWVLHYVSEREGLAPMVIGLLRGLARRFDESVAIEQLAGDDPRRASFRVRRIRAEDGDD